ncbi:MAG: ATP-binding cassette domain-containing protein [Chloroflexi bacterium]|nr:ATP-binding cassette domain-containing protein [Chloroflexota bacterium]
MKVELRNIHKSFGPVHANNGITLNVPAGTIQGILGENGAGKSTLMKILSGFIREDAGEIVLDGKTVRIDTPSDAIKYGIGMLHQDPLDFLPMRVLDNFIIGAEGGVFPNKTQARKEFTDLQAQFHFNIDPDAYVDSLTVGERQQLEILRLLWLGARVLILDEPTTGISSSQREKLFATLRILSEQGKTLFFVSHKLEEVEGLCHRIAVFRQGEVVGEVSPPYTTDDLVRLMFGKEVKLKEREEIAREGAGIRFQNITIEDSRMRISNIDLDIRPGEVIGLAGMAGSGQRQFLKACCGLLKPVAGKVHLREKDLTGKPYHEFLANGVAYVPASRLEEGLIEGLTLNEHFILADKQEGFIINRDKYKTITQERIQEFNIKGRPGSPVEALSGGNQQRALLALMKTPLRFLLVEHPTRGLDVESSIYIWGKLKERCRQGTSIVFISADLEEILHYSDRVLVFFGGKVSRPLDARSTSVDQLGQLIGGKGFEA